MRAEGIPLFGPGYRGKSPLLTAQRRLNCYVEQYGADADRAPFNLIQRPGLTKVATVLDLAGGPINTPTRAISEIFSSSVATPFGDLGVPRDSVLLFSNQYAAFYAPDLNTNPAYGLGPLGTSSGKIRTSSNSFQILGTDGGPCFSYDLTSGVLTLLNTITNFPVGATTCCFIAGRHVVNDPARNGGFRWSGTYNAISWGANDFATAETAPDPLAMVLESSGELWLVGRDTIEFWAPTTDSRIFARIGSAGVDFGTSALWTVVKVHGGVAFLGRMRGGAGAGGGERQVFFVQGHQCAAISSPDVNTDINAVVEPDQATAVAFTIGGHDFYVLNLPGTSWAFDFTTGTWNEWQTAGGRWCVENVMSAFGMVLCTDYRDSRIYMLDVNGMTDDGTAIERELITKHVVQSGNWVTVDELQIDAECGSATIPAVYPAAIDLRFNNPAELNALNALPSSSYLTSTTAFVPNTASFTMQAWVKVRANAPIGIIMQKETAGFFPQVFFNSGNFVFQNGFAANVSIGLSQVGDTWHLLTASFDSSTMQPRIWLDVTGPVVGAPGADFGGASAALTTCVGANSIGSNLFWGSISEVRVWNYAFTTTAQVLASLNNCSGHETGLVGLLQSFTPGVDDCVTQGLRGMIYHGYASRINWQVYDEVSGAVVKVLPIPYRDNQTITPARAPQLMASWSKDGGRTFGNEVWQGLGLQGEYRNRAVWRNIGRTRDLVLKLRMTDPARLVLSAANLRVR